MIGLDEKAKMEFADIKVDSIIADMEKLLDPAVECQSANVILQQSFTGAVNYIFRTLPPQCCINAAERMEQRMLQIYCEKNVLNIQQIVNSPGLVDKIFSKTGENGMGIPSPLRIPMVAYLAGVAQAGSSMVRYTPNPTCVPIHSRLSTSADSHSSSSSSSSSSSLPAAFEYQAPRKDTDAPLLLSHNIFEKVLSNSFISQSSSTSSSSSSSSSTITHMSIGDNVEFCLRQLDRHGVDSAALNQHSDKIIMPFEIQAFGEFFSDAALGETRAFKLQSLLFKKVEAVRGARRLAEWDKDEISVEQRIRQKCCSNHGAQAWANALPVGLLKLTNMEMHVAISSSLGIPPYFYSKGYAPIRCKHASVSTSCNNVDLRTDLNHALSCPFERKRGTNTRHNKVQSLLEEFANLCNARVTHPQDLSKGLEHSSERLDFVVEFFKDAVGVDVTCVNPTAKSYHAVNKNDHTTASKNAYLDKMKKYAPLSAANDLPILPFVAETYGGIYHKSRQLLSKMADQMPSGLYAGNRLASKHYYTTAITVSIMRENARIITRAHQHAAIT